MPALLSRLSPYSLALVLAFAGQLGWSAVVIIAASLIHEARQDEATGATYETLTFTAAGEAVVARTTTRYYPRYSTHTEYLNAADRSPHAADRLSPLPVASLSAPALPTTNRFQRVLALPTDPLELQSPPGREQLIVPDGAWRAAYFVVAEANSTPGRGYFEAFSRDSRIRLGFVGTAGFREERPPEDEQFQLGTGRPGYHYGRSILWHTDLEQLRGRIQNPAVGQPGMAIVSDREPGFPFHPGQCIVLSRGRALLVDVAKSTVVPIHPADDVRAMAVVAHPAALFTPAAAAEHDSASEDVLLSIALRTTTQLLVVHPRSGAWRKYSLAEGLTDDPLSVQFLPDGAARLQQSERWRGWPHHDHGEHAVSVYPYAPDGEPGPPLHTVLKLYPYSGVVMGAWEQRNLFTLAGGAPLSAAVIALGLLPYADDMVWAESRSAAVGVTLRDAWPSLVISLLLGLGAALFALRWQSRRGGPREWGWIACVFLLGFPGYWGYRLHRQWPAQGIPEPQLLGIEVFG